MPQRKRWWEDAQCRWADPRIFEGLHKRGRRSPGSPVSDWSEAQQVCARCPVQAECLEEALGVDPYTASGGGHGTYYLFQAGFTPQELTQLRRKRRAG